MAVSEIANAIENVQQPQDFYRQTGRSDFAYGSQNPVFGLTIQKLELAHQGEDATPFLSAANLRFRRGEWTFLKGESGGGKRPGAQRLRKIFVGSRCCPIAHVDVRMRIGLAKTTVFLYSVCV